MSEKKKTQEEQHDENPRAFVMALEKRVAALEGKGAKASKPEEKKQPEKKEAGK